MNKLGYVVCYLKKRHTFPKITRHKNNWWHYTCTRCGFGIKSHLTGVHSVGTGNNFFQVLREGKI